MPQFKLDDYVYPKRINWENVFLDIEGENITPSQIANLIGVAWSSLDRWRKGGVEPRYSTGRALLILHTRYCGEELTQQRISEASRQPTNQHSIRQKSRESR